MAKLQDYKIQNFDGGLVVNKGDYELNKNEFVNTLNLDLEEKGKVKRRRGIQEYCQTSTQVLGASYSWYQQTAGSPPTHYHFAVGRSVGGAGADLYRVNSTYLTVAAAVGDTTLTVGNNGGLAASGTLEINGDLIAYTGKSGGTGLTGVSGILVAHPAFSLVNQFGTAISAAVDSRPTVYFASLNNLLIINGFAGTKGTFDGVTFTTIADDDQPAGIFATNWRDRIWVAGDSSTNGADTRNGDPRRVSFSDEGDATSWDLNNFFDVEDERGESITGLQNGIDKLLIFKTNSIWSYDELNLIRSIDGIGAYSHKVVQKIGNLFYTFCPTGVYVTNGSTVKKISDPIEKYIRSFAPQHDTTRGRVVINTFAGKYDDKYYLYIGDITDPETLSDVVLIYDTIRQNWTVHDSYTNLNDFASLTSIGNGDANDATGSFRPQDLETLFASDDSNQYFRLFDNRFLDNQATRTYRGGDILGNMKANSVGNPISTVLETGWIDFGSDEWKKIGSIMMVVERGNLQLSYQMDHGRTKTDWISLGYFQAGIHTKKLRIDSVKGYNFNEGYRIKIRVTSNSLEVNDILNSIIVRDIETTDKVIYAEYDGQR